MQRPERLSRTFPAGPETAGRGEGGAPGARGRRGLPRVLPVTFVVAEGAAWTAVDHKPKSVPGERLAPVAVARQAPSVEPHRGSLRRRLEPPRRRVEHAGAHRGAGRGGASHDRLRARGPLPAVPGAPRAGPLLRLMSRQGPQLEGGRPIVIGRRWPRCGFSTRRRRARARRWCRSRRCCAKPEPKPTAPAAAGTRSTARAGAGARSRRRGSGWWRSGRRVLSDDASTRETIAVLEGLRSVVDVSIYRWAEAAGEWRPLTPREKKTLWGFRGRLPSD